MGFLWDVDPAIKSSIKADPQLSLSRRNTKEFE
jgi:hypothetical protein